MLKRTFALLLTTIIIDAGSLCALLHPHVEKGEQWGVAAEYLYWRPDFDKSSFVIVQDNPAATTTVGGDFKNNDFGFNSGFRLEGAWAFDRSGELHLRYARLQTDSTKTISGPGLVQTQGTIPPQSLTPYTGFARSDLDVRFQNVELLYSSRILDRCSSNLDFYVFAGLQYFDIKREERYQYQQTVAPFASSIISRSDNFYGIGPELGFELAYPLHLCFCGFNNRDFTIVGQASGSLLAHHSDFSYNDTSFGVTFENVRDENVWRVIPALNARIGLLYSACWCLDFDLEIGYEFSSYLRSNTVLESPAGFGIFASGYTNTNLQGLYLSLGVAF